MLPVMARIAGRLFSEPDYNRRPSRYDIYPDGKCPDKYTTSISDDMVQLVDWINSSLKNTVNACIVGR